MPTAAPGDRFYPGDILRSDEVMFGVGSLRMLLDIASTWHKNEVWRMRPLIDVEQLLMQSGVISSDLLRIHEAVGSIDSLST